MACRCDGCGRRYAYAVDVCTFCGASTVVSADSEGEVIAVTRVETPSIGHEDVPYWCALVRAVDGSQTVLKSDQALAVGQTVHVGGGELPELPVVGVIGTGIMGRGLVELLLARGHNVVWCGRSERRLCEARDRVFGRLPRGMDERDLDRAAAHLRISVGYERLSECDVVIEAVVEEMEPKAAVLSSVENAMREDAVLATNTSGLSLEALSGQLVHPERFGGLHFFNPADRMRLVETTVCSRTTPEVAEFLDSFARSIGKVPVRVAATPAFVVNRALMPLLNEAVRLLEEEAAPADSIDEAIRLGLNHPMGPLALADLIGLDVVVDIMENLASETGDEVYLPRPLLRELVAAGRLGRKTGRGFYDYAV